VLLVDDHPVRLVQATDSFEALGYWVAIARSKPEAMAKIAALNPVVTVIGPTLWASIGPDGLDLLNNQRQNHQRQNHQRQTPQFWTTLLSTELDGSPPASASSNYQSDRAVDGVLHFPLTAATLAQTLDALPRRGRSGSSFVFDQPITVLHFKPVRLEPGHKPPSPAADGHAHLDDPDGQDAGPFNPPGNLDLNALLHPYNCRVIEVDSITQAELLAKVWKPDVAVWGGYGWDRYLPDDPDKRQIVQDILTGFGQCDELNRLPLITLTPNLTQAAHQSVLRVFPCLDPALPIPSDRDAHTDLALVHVIRAAVTTPSERRA